MHILPIPALKDNYIWAIINQQQAIIVDPGEAAPVVRFLRQHAVELTGILITHHHWDHTNGIAELKDRYPVPVYRAPQITDGDTITLNDINFTVIAIPGHTLDHVAYYANGCLFCGDTLFAAGCGRLFEGTPLQMYTSLQKLAALPDDTAIYCGHEYTAANLRFAETVEPNNISIRERIQQVDNIRAQQLPSLPTTLRVEKATNPFLRCTSSELIAQVEAQSKQQLGDSIDVFTQLRRWKDAF